MATNSHHQLRFKCNKYGSESTLGVRVMKCVMCDSDGGAGDACAVCDSDGDGDAGDVCAVCDSDVMVVQVMFLPCVTVMVMVVQVTVM
jgi:hypothetical protein